MGIEAVKIMDVLGEYDTFQYENNIKPDYSNVGGLEIYEDGEWVEWGDPEWGHNIDEWREAQEREKSDG
jgi:hypothetical protein